MAKFLSSQLTLLFTFLLVLHANCRISLAMSTITAMAKDQIACTTCSSCDNPCQPIFSPPPSPSPVPCPQPPSPPPPPPLPSGPYCPPPSLPPCGSDCPQPPLPSCGSDCLQPPPLPESPSTSDGTLPFPIPPPPVILPFPAPPLPAGIFPFPSPPNPMFPYFPFYYHSPPPPSSSSDMSNSIRLRSYQFASFVVVSVSLLSLI